MLLGLGLDGRVLGFTAAIALGTCLLFGLAPALRATRIAPAAAMRAGGRGLTTGRERFSLRRSLVVAQVALSLVLLVGALLFIGSLRNLMAVDPGFRVEGSGTGGPGFLPRPLSARTLPQIHRGTAGTSARASGRGGGGGGSKRAAERQPFRTICAGLKARAASSSSRTSITSARDISRLRARHCSPGGISMTATRRVLPRWRLSMKFSPKRFSAAAIRWAARF